jgi:hypothetical protein
MGRTRPPVRVLGGVRVWSARVARPDHACRSADWGSTALHPARLRYRDPRNSPDRSDRPDQWDRHLYVPAPTTGTGVLDSVLDCTRILCQGEHLAATSPQHARHFYDGRWHSSRHRPSPSRPDPPRFHRSRLASTNETMTPLCVGRPNEPVTLYRGCTPGQTPLRHVMDNRPR